MVAYNFKPQFVPLIIGGTKTMTLRHTRDGKSRHARPGERLTLYTGQRTKDCRLIGTAVCKSSNVVHISFDLHKSRAAAIIAASAMSGLDVWAAVDHPPAGTLGVLRPDDHEAWRQFAVADGFPSFLQFVGYWNSVTRHRAGWDFATTGLVTGFTYVYTAIAWRDFSPAETDGVLPR